MANWSRHVQNLGRRQGQKSRALMGLRHEFQVQIGPSASLTSTAFKKNKIAHKTDASE